MDFFDHPFLDLDHFPEKDSLLRASKIATEAVAADKSKDKERAVELYEEALKHFRLILYYEVKTTFAYLFSTFLHFSLHQKSERPCGNQ